MNAQRWTHMKSQESSQRPLSHPPVYVQKLQSQLKTWLTGADPWVSRLGKRSAFWEAYIGLLNSDGGSTLDGKWRCCPLSDLIWGDMEHMELGELRLRTLSRSTQMSWVWKLSILSIRLYPYQSKVVQSKFYRFARSLNEWHTQCFARTLNS